MRLRCRRGLFSILSCQISAPEGSTRRPTHLIAALPSHSPAPIPSRVAGDGLEYLPETDKPRPHGRKCLNRDCEEFSRTNSYQPGDYAEITMNASYTLALIRAYFDSQRTMA